MNKRSLLILAALALGLVYLPKAQAFSHGDRIPSEVSEVETAEESGKVCFCHNLDHHPHTICTSEEGLIHGHMLHVENEGPGIHDALGACEVESEGEDGENPGDVEEGEPVETPEADTPCDDDHGDEGEVEEPSESPIPAEETPEVEANEPGDDATPGDEVDSNIPEGDTGDGELPEPTKVDGFEPGAQAASDIAAAAPSRPGVYFEGSGCSLGTPLSGTSDLAAWALLAALVMISPLRRIRK